MIIGVLQVEVRIPGAHSLKEKRSVLNSVKDQLRGRFNIAVAELDANEKWQRATVGISTVGEDRVSVDRLLQHVAEWMRMTPLIELIRVEQEYF